MSHTPESGGTGPGILGQSPGQIPGPSHAPGGSPPGRPSRLRFFLSLGAGLLALFLGSLLLLSRSPRTWRFVTQEAASLLSGKGKDRAESRFRQRLEALGRDPQALLPRLVVVKSRHELGLFDGELHLASFPVGLGMEPVGQKQKGADFRTPEGEYFLCYKKEDSRYHLFLGFSYPSPEDASRGLQAGLITATETEAILDACMKKERPPWNTGLGGPFGIHGYGADADWTEGTLAMCNAHVEELFWNLPFQTSLTVLP